MKSTLTSRVSLWRVICLGLLALVVPAVLCGPAEAGTFAYVSNSVSSSVSVIDTNTNTVVATIPLANNLANIAAAPDGTRVYVASNPGNAVYVINTLTNTVMGTIPVTSAQGIGVTPDGTRAYVTNANTPGVVSVIDTFSNSVVATIPVTDRPWFVRFTPDGSKGFVVGNGAPGTVEVIDTNPSSGTYNTVLATIPAGTFPAGVGITPDGKFAYVTNGLSDDVLVIDTSSYNVVTTIPLSSGPGFIAVGSSRAYVPLFFGAYVWVINTLTNKNIARVPVGPAPTAAAFTPNEGRVYVTNSGRNTVSVISTASNTVVATITVGSHPYDVAIARPCGCN